MTCMHHEVENLVCIDCGRAFDSAEDWHDAQREAESAVEEIKSAA